MRTTLITVCVALTLALSPTTKGFAQWQSEFNYGTAFSTGQFHDFTPSSSFWNWQYQARKQITDRYEVGGAASWSYFEHDFGRITRVGEGFALTANTTAYTNILAFQFVNQYNLTDDGEAVPFVRLGIGAAHQNQQENIGLYTISNSGWQFILNPEAGVRIELNYYLGLLVAGGYTYLPESGGMLPTSFWNLKVGLTWLRF